MNQDKDVLAMVADAVAADVPIDWTVADSNELTPTEREILSQLRILEGVRIVHRVTDTLATPRSSDALSAETAPAPATRPAPAFPSTWAHLELRGRLGTGAFGTVYRAWDPRLATDVALKLLTRVTPTDSSVVEEARLLARVRHPNIVTVYGADRVNGQVGLWMELLHGRTLKDILGEHGRLSAREAATFALELTRALAAVHAAGLVHRDIKPQNVMREEGGRIILMDFGAGGDAEGRRLGTPAGTPLYMAPELLRGQRASAQTDLYALGVLLFHLVTGGYPVEGSTMSEVLASHGCGRRRLRDLRPELPTEFVRIVERAIDDTPANRYGSAGEMEQDLARFVVGGEAPAVSTPARQYPRLVWGAALAALVLAAAVGLVTWRPWEPQPPAAVSAAGLRSLAVLPFTNLSGNAEEDYFVDGMTDILTTELSGLSALRITSRTSAMTYRSGPKKPIRQIARELGVEGVIEGSVAKSGNRMRVAVKVIHAGADVQVWGQTYERDVKDLFALQAEIARTIAAQLRAALSERERRQLTQVYTAVPAAQDLYLRAYALIQTLNRDNIQKGRVLLERAVAIDPNYPRAWATLANCYTMLEDWNVLSPAETKGLAGHAAQEALSRDPMLPDALLAFAEVLFKVDWNWSSAQDYYRRAIEASPSSSQARNLYARFLAAAGRVDESVVEARRAEEVDPAAAGTKRSLAMMLYYQRRYADAERKAAEAIAQGTSHPGGHFVRGRALEALGRYDEAAVEIKEAVRLSEASGQLVELGRVHALAGRTREAEEILNRVSTERTETGDPVFAKLNAAYVQIALGRRDEAIAGLTQAVDARTERILWLRVDPRLDPLQSDPRFKRLIGRIGGLESGK